MRSRYACASALEPPAAVAPSGSLAPSELPFQSQHLDLKESLEVMQKRAHFARLNDFIRM